MHGRRGIVPVAGPISGVTGVSTHTGHITRVSAPAALVPASVIEAVSPAPASVAVLVTKLTSTELRLTGQRLGLQEG